MIKRVIYLVATRFNVRDSVRFGVQIMQDNGFDVEVWDVSEIVRKKIASQIWMPDSIESKTSYRLIRWEDKHQFIRELKGLKNDTFVINLLDVSIGQSRWIINNIAVQYARVRTAHMPVFATEEKTLKQSFVKIKKLLSPRLVYKYIKRKIDSYAFVKPASLVFLGGVVHLFQQGKQIKAASLFMCIHWIMICI